MTTKHGMYGTPIYEIWHGMKARTTNPKMRDYPRYGGRGITVCDEWKESFEAFYRDMGDRPEGLSLERKDNNGPYSKANCVWATVSQQARNRRNNHFLTLNGVRKTIIEWSEETGLTYGTIHGRVWSLGWDDEKALTTPTRLDARHGQPRGRVRV